MVEITMSNGTICVATRVFAVLSAHDDEGKKTYYVAQIQGARRRLAPEQIRAVNVLTG
jgi:hypothetical protein